MLQLFAYFIYKIQEVYISSPIFYRCLHTVCADIYIASVYLIGMYTHTRYFYSLHNSVYIGLILITSMYLYCASNTRNIQVSDRDSVSADTQYSVTLIRLGKKVKVRTSKTSWPGARSKGTSNDTKKICLVILSLFSKS